MDSRLKFGLQQSNNDATNLSESALHVERGRLYDHPVRPARRQLPRVVPDGQYVAGGRGAWARGHQHRSEDQQRRGPVRALRNTGLGRGRWRSLLERGDRLPERIHLQSAGHLGRRILADGAWSPATVRNWWRAITIYCSPNGSASPSICRSCDGATSGWRTVRLSAARRAPAGGVLGSGPVRSN